MHRPYLPALSSLLLSLPMSAFCSISTLTKDSCSLVNLFSVGHSRIQTIDVGVDRSGHH